MIDSQTDWTQVQSAIADAESQTAAEIVVTVVRKSGSYGHLSWFVSIVCLVLFLLGHVDAWIYHHVIPFAWPSWLSLLVLFVLARVVGLALANIPCVIRMFSTSETLARWTELRAEAEFFEKIHGNTLENMGVLVFVSLTERRAMILADKKIMGQVPEGFFNGLMVALLTSIRAKDLVGGLAKTVVEVGQVLKMKFPVQPCDRNELDDRVIFKEQ